MNVLRIYCSLLEAPLRCQWVLLSTGRAPAAGAGPLAELPRAADRVQLIIPAAEVLLTRARLPRGVRRHSDAVLAYAVETETLGEPEANQVTWLGATGDEDALAVINKKSLTQWLEALAGAGLGQCEVCCETLMLPWKDGEWSLAWSGSEGYVRTGAFEGAATDCGDRNAPPLSLRMMLKAARGALPNAIAIYTTAPDAEPDIDAWQRELGVTLRRAGSWTWRTATIDAGISLTRPRRHWRSALRTLAPLRTAAWIAGAALFIHAALLAADWTLLSGEQRSLRQKMEARFRATFPDAVALVDPALQMSRKLAEARHAAGQVDGGDFLPMIENAALALKDVPPGSVRRISFEYGRLTLDLSVVDDARVRQILARLGQAGLKTELAPAAGRTSSGTLTVTVRAS